MLIQFTVGNFLSFKEKTTFSMLASPEEPGHEDRVVKINEDISVLRIAAIYGANASGKSNLLAAIHSAKALINNGIGINNPIPYMPFSLSKSQDKDTFIEFIISVKSNIYTYGFTYNTDNITSEWLTNTNTNDNFFCRKSDEEQDTIDFNDNKINELGGDAEFLNFIKKGTRKNQLFLIELASKNIQKALDVWSWFQVNLIIPDALYPESKGILMYRINDENIQSLSRLVMNADTGISEIRISPEAVNMTREYESMQSFMSSNSDFVFSIIENGPRKRLKFNSETKKIEEIKFQFQHLNEWFDEHQESLGTIRLIEMWENLMSFTEMPRTVLIDEIELSMHPGLVRFLAEFWMQNTTNENQLIFTTHNDNLLEDDLLRRDEVWMVTKNKTGASELASLVEYKIQPGTDMQKAYLRGWFNGVPRLGPRNFYHTIRENTASDAPAS
ncbi:MAG: ATP-binding protein [Armatimonas sp.]